MTEKTWTFLNQKFDEATSHAPPRTVCEELVATDLEALWKSEAAKDPTVTRLAEMERVPTKTVWLDLGGIAHKDRKIYSLDPIEGLTITIPANDVAAYLDLLQAASEREPEKIGEKGYYTLQSMHVGVLLSVDQCILLAVRLRTILPEAEAIASIENDAFNRQMDKVGVRANRRPTIPTGEA